MRMISMNLTILSIVITKFEVDYTTSFNLYHSKNTIEENDNFDSHYLILTNDVHFPQGTCLKRIPI